MSSSQMTLMDNRLSILLAIDYSSINVATTKHTEALLILSFPELIIFLLHGIKFCKVAAHVLYLNNVY